MPNCCAYNCKSKRVKVGTAPTDQLGPKLTFHKFPFSKPNLVRRWVWETRLKNFKPKKQHVLCSLHFEEKHFDRTGQTTRLREGAIPTIFDFPSHMKKVITPRRSIYKRPRPPPDIDIKSEPANPPATNEIVPAPVNAAETTPLDGTNLLALDANDTPVIIHFEAPTSGTIDILSAAAAVIDAVDLDIFIDPLRLSPTISLAPLQPSDDPAPSPADESKPNSPLPPAAPMPPPSPRPCPGPHPRRRGRPRGKAVPSLLAARLKSAVIPPFRLCAATQTDAVARWTVASQTLVQVPVPKLEPTPVVASLQDHCTLIQGEKHFQDGLGKLQRRLQHEKDKNFHLRKKLRMSQQRIRRLNKRIVSFKGKVRHLHQEKAATADADGLLNSTLSGLPLALVSRIVGNRLKEKQSKKVFAPEIRAFAMKLHACSPKAYGFVRETFERVLPHPSVVRAWLGHVPGFSKEEVEALEAVELSFENEPEGQMVNVLEVEQASENQMAADLLTHAFFVDIGGGTTEYNIVTVAAEELV